MGADTRVEGEACELEPDKPGSVEIAARRLALSRPHSVDSEGSQDPRGAPLHTGLSYDLSLLASSKESTADKATPPDRKRGQAVVDRSDVDPANDRATEGCGSSVGKRLRAGVLDALSEDSVVGQAEQGATRVPVWRPGLGADLHPYDMEKIWH